MKQTKQNKMKIKKLKTFEEQYGETIELNPKKRKENRKEAFRKINEIISKEIK